MFDSACVDRKVLGALSANDICRTHTHQFSVLFLDTKGVETVARTARSLGNDVASALRTAPALKCVISYLFLNFRAPALH